MRSPITIRRTFLALLVLVVGLAVPAAVAAHPLGNFTINHYAGLRVGPQAISLDVVVDYAEIPAFQERLTIDTNGDGDVSQAEADSARSVECNALAPSLDLEVHGARQALTLREAGIQFPAGAGGVPTMRVVCEFEAAIGAPLTDGSVVTFQDTSYSERIGWREIVVLGDGTSIAAVPGGAAPSATDLSTRLTAYPRNLLTQPLDIRSAAFTFTAGGPALEPFIAPDASSLDGSPAAGGTAAAGGPGSIAGAGAGPAGSALAAVPGGVGADIPDLFRVADLTPLLVLASIALAMALGAGHALTPGHGKTLMAAYLVGTRGTVRHAVGLGLAVTVSHTFGILALALLVTGAESLLPPDVVVRAVPVVAALAFVAIGGSMLLAEIGRRYRGGRLAAEALAHDHDRDHSHDDERDHAPEHEHEHGHEDAHVHASGHAPDRATAVARMERSLEHSHGPVRHTHLPANNQTLSWKSLLALGLAGGIIPSTNALIILLGTIVAGRAAFGVVLVVAFGLGMAIVLGGVGALMVLARGRLDRMPSSSTLGAVARQAPLIASVAVLGIGLWLTVQAVSGVPVL